MALAIGTAAVSASEKRFARALPPAASLLPATQFEPLYDHQFVVSQDVEDEADALWRLAMEDQPVQRILSLVDRRDASVGQHLRRSSRAFPRLAVHLGIPAEETILGTQAQAVDDAGKVDRKVREALHSPDKFADNPTLLPRIERHPWLSVVLADRAGADPVVTFLSGNHHGVQPSGRKPYTVFDNLRTAEDSNGRRVNVRRLLEVMTVIDVLDAIYRIPELRLQDSQRLYRQDEPGSYGFAMGIIKTLPLENDDIVPALAEILPVRPPKLHSGALAA